MYYEKQRTNYSDSGGSTMTAEAQIIAIAEACGWHTIVSPDDPLFMRLINPEGFTSASWSRKEKLTIASYLFKVPAYLEDLNAMHEAEKALHELPDGTFQRYLRTLEEVVTRDIKGWSRASEMVIVATARQRAEAFLRTLTLWKEEAGQFT